MPGQAKVLEEAVQEVSLAIFFHSSMLYYCDTCGRNSREGLITRGTQG